MHDFRIQIQEDIKEYQAQERFKGVPEILNDDWAFNYWILDKFFYEDEEVILGHITDNKDCGIDAFEWYEATGDLYLIQNKYYSTSRVTLEYVQNTFLAHPLSVLENGTYKRSKELQQIYSTNVGRETFTIHLQMYVTNDLRDPEIDDAIREFNRKNSPRIIAEIFYLSDIAAKWYGEPRKITTTLDVHIQSVNQSTMLTLNNADSHLANVVDARYVYTPVSCLYRMVRLAQENGYPLFESNIREYLGNRGINKGIFNTLKNPNERRNFFYYNNGITMICESIGDTEVSENGDSEHHFGIQFVVHNPQIVNGCQTVNSIYQALDQYQEDEIEGEFADAFVMVKILQIDSQKAEQKDLAQKIVRYNNSQNSIDEKAFTANLELFQRYKSEFEAKGFLILTKQSDKATYAEKYSSKSKFGKLRSLSISRREIFGLDSQKKIAEFHIPLEKLLQVILAFKVGGLAAYTQKKDVLHPDKEPYRIAVEFLSNSKVTTETLLSLYLLYSRFEKDKNAQKSKTASDGTPAGTGIIPFYAIEMFARYECGGDVGKIVENVASKQQVDRLAKLYTIACYTYASMYQRDNNVDYTMMIKSEIDISTLRFAYDQAKKTLAMVMP